MSVFKINLNNTSQAVCDSLISKDSALSEKLLKIWSLFLVTEEQLTVRVGYFQTVSGRVRERHCSGEAYNQYSESRKASAFVTVNDFVKKFCFSEYQNELFFIFLINI